MRIFSILMTLVLVAAVIAPMYMKGPSGQPIMTPDDWVPETPAPLKAQAPMFKWRDEHGVWQFGEDPPEGIAATIVELDRDRVTPLGEEWNVEPLVTEKESEPAAGSQLDRLMELMPR